MRLSTSIICSMVRLPSAANLQQQQPSHVAGPTTSLHGCCTARSSVRGTYLHASAFSPAALVPSVWISACCMPPVRSLFRSTWQLHHNMLPKMPVGGIITTNRMTAPSCAFLEVVKMLFVGGLCLAAHLDLKVERPGSAT